MCWGKWTQKQLCALRDEMAPDSRCDENGMCGAASMNMKM